MDSTTSAPAQAATCPAQAASAGTEAGSTAAAAAAPPTADIQVRQQQIMAGATPTGDAPAAVDMVAAAAAGADRAAAAAGGTTTGTSARCKTPCVTKQVLQEQEQQWGSDNALLAGLREMAKGNSGERAGFAGG